MKAGFPMTETNSPDPAESPDADGSLDLDALRERVIATLKSCYDPEIPVDVYELGLIYKIDIDDEGSVSIGENRLSHDDGISHLDHHGCCFCGCELFFRHGQTMGNR